jgi:opacity protein-like surface antigen
MKSSPILLAALLGICLATAGSALASPRAAEAAGSHYLLAADNLNGWHLGGFYRYADRELDHGAYALKQNKFMVHLGHDVLSWLSIYAFLGTTTLEVEPGFGDRDPDLEYGAGAWANLLDHDLLGNFALETRLRLQAIGQVSASSPEIDGREASYVEFYGALTLGVVNELIGNKAYWPEAIGLFFGPVYNDISSDDIDATGSAFGLTGGLDIYLTRDTTLSLSYEAFDSDKIYNAALNFRF